MKLELIKGQSDGPRVFSVDAESACVIGRSGKCEISLRDPNISRRHAEILRHDDGFAVRDLKSRNGIRLNGVAVSQAPLRDGDILAVGSYELRVSDAVPQAPPIADGVAFQETQSRVALTLHHREADILLGADRAGDADIEHENRMLREICEVAKIIAGRGEPAVILQQALDTLHSVLDADTVCLLMREPADENAWRARAVSNQTSGRASVQVSRSIVNGALREGHAFLTTDPLEDARFDPSLSIVSHGVSSAVCTPLTIGGSFDGVLYIDRRRRRSVFDSLDLRLAATAGNLLALFLEKERYENEVREKTRLAVIGEVVAGLAHCVKNVLAGLEMSVAVFEMAVERNKPEAVASTLKTMRDIQRRISELMLNMLSYAKERRPQPTVVDMDRLADDLANPYRARLEEQGVAFDYRRDPDAVVYADEQSLHRVLLNLFLNALDAMDAGNDGRPKRIRLEVRPEKKLGVVVLTVSDTGPGIPPDKLERIFNSFFSTKGSRGTGLGLAVSRKIIEEHGGTLSVTSEEGCGTEFLIRLPAAPEDSSLAEPEA